MIRFRSFRNNDPRELAEIWRSSANKRGLMQPMSADLLERLVLAKPYFDNDGLIVAEEDGRAVGFVHAGFGPNETGSTLSYEEGVIAIIAVRPEFRRSKVGSQLVEKAEQYLAGHGARVVYGGGTWRMNPFYLGLYGGSQLPGILDSDPDGKEFVEANGYQAVGRRWIFQREISTFRPRVDRQLMRIRRGYRIEIDMDPAPLNWWDACTFGGFERWQASLMPVSGNEVVASAMAWFLDPLSATWGLKAVGLTHLHVAESSRRSGLATYLLGELFRALHTQGVSLAELQCDEKDEVAIGMSRKLGFQHIDTGTIYRKELTPTKAPASDSDVDRLSWHNSD